MGFAPRALPVGMRDSCRSVTLFFGQRTTVLVQKQLDPGGGQGLSRFKSGANTAVREHFEPAHNAVIGQEMIVFESF
jgi:hypothetical protein